MLIYKSLSIVSYTLFLPIFIFSAIILIIIGFIYLPLFYALDKLCCRLIMAAFFIWPKIRGSFPKHGTYIIMMNHSSFLDVFIFPLIPIGHYTGVAAAKNFNIPIFSFILRQIRAIPIERKNLQAAIKSIKKAERVLKNNVHIGILPEGTRTLSGRIGPLKKGSFHMAINTNTPIVPVGVSGAFSFKPKNRWWTRPVCITINIGAVINTKSYNELGLEGLMGLVGEKLKELSGEKYENK